MGGPIAVLVFLARIIITIHVKIFLFLIKHFDITNGLIVSLFVQVFTQDTQVNIWVRISVLALITAGSVILQHFFRPARIVFGLVSSFFCGLIAYGIFQDSKVMPWIPFVIAFLITAGLNYLNWYRVGLSDKVEEYN